jgi:hypothetical protein
MVELCKVHIRSRRWLRVFGSDEGNGYDLSGLSSPEKGSSVMSLLLFRVKQVP